MAVSQDLLSQRLGKKEVDSRTDAWIIQAAEMPVDFASE